MKVILLESVARVGQRDAVVEVADGFALNFLIPQGKAQQATPERIAQLDKQLAMGRDARAADAAHLAEALQGLEGKRVVMKARANDKGKLFRGVGAEEIAREIGSQAGVALDPAMIEGFADPLKSVGDYRLTLAGAGKRAEVVLAIEAA